MERVVYVDQPSALLSEGLRGSRVGKIHGDVFRCCLEEGAGAPSNGDRFAFELEKESACSRGKWSGH